MNVWLPLISAFMTGVLICATLNRSRHRLLIKMATCTLFVWLGLIPAIKGGMETQDRWILAGLCLSFLGDLALELKGKDRLFLVGGIVFFTSAQAAYLLGFPVMKEGLWIWAVLCPIQALVLKLLTRQRRIELPQPIRSPVLIYDACLLGVLALALVAVVRDPSLKNGLRILAALAFVLSDTLLFPVYFAKPTRSAETIGYLSLYHLAQTLYALSLWN